MDKRTGVVVGVSSVVAVILAVAVVAVAGGGSDHSSVSSGGDQNASSAPVGDPGAAGASGQPNSGSGGAGASGQPNGGSGGAGASATGTPHGTSASSPHGTTASTHATTPTTIHNTIKPIPGRPVPPAFDSATAEPSCAPGSCEELPDGSKVGVCHGTPPHALIAPSWRTSHADYVQVNRGANNYPASFSGITVLAPCDHIDNSVSVALYAFGPGGEVFTVVGIRVDPQFRP